MFDVDCFQSSLGGLDHAQELKNSRRLELGLDPLPEDSIKVVRQMRASTPPLIASEMLDQQQNPGASIVPPNTTAGGSPSAAAKKRAAGKRLNKGANASGGGVVFKCTRWLTAIRLRPKVV